MIAQDFWASDVGFRAVLLEAERRGIPVRPLGALSIAVLGEGEREIRLNGGITGRTSHLAVRLAGNKVATKAVLSQAGIPTPEGRAFADMIEARDYFHRLGRPVVVKPVTGHLGRGVCTGVADDAAFVTAWREAVHHSKPVLVESMEAGRDFRVLVAGRRAIAVAERTPPTVTGDGESTLADLIEALNESPGRGGSHELPTTKIPLDVELLHTVSRDGKSLSSVPKRGEVVRLRRAANLSRGASSIDRTEDIHPDNAQLAVEAAAITGLDIAGVDMLADDITVSWRLGGLSVLEVNSTPGLRMHLFPGSGRSRPVHEAILDHLFPRQI